MVFRHKNITDCGNIENAVKAARVISNIKQYPFQ